MKSNKSSLITQEFSSDAYVKGLKYLVKYEQSGDIRNTAKH